jgi:hypothetical protein
MELDPKYVDVVVQRWQTLSGKQATLEGDGRTFEAIAEERRKAEAWIARCRREVAEIEAQLRAGHPDVKGLCLALADWSGEIRLIEKELGTARSPAGTG